MIRVILPAHLKALARISSEVQLELSNAPTRAALLDALEEQYPVLRGTIRDHITHKRRPFLRFFACKADLTFERPDARLPDAVVNGSEPFIILGAMAGG